MKFKTYISEKDDTEPMLPKATMRVQRVFKKLMKPDFIWPEQKLPDFEKSVMGTIRDEYPENVDPAHVIAGYAKTRFTKKDLELMMELLQEVLADKSVDVKAYYGVNLGRLEVILDRMIKGK